MQLALTSECGRENGQELLTLIDNGRGKGKGKCYRLDKRLKGLAVSATPPGSAAHMTCVSYTSRASARGLASGRRSSRSILTGCLSLVSG
jgi:hypothetical protein